MSATIRYRPNSARRILIVANPSAGSGANRATVQRLLDYLKANGFEAEVTSDLARLNDLKDDAGQADLRAVVAAGGDGTVAEIVNRTAASTPIAVLPLGTENLLAKHLGMLADPEQVGHAIVHGATICIDAGLAAERVFLLMAGIGFDADVVRRLASQRSGNIRHISYVKPILQAMHGYTYPKLRVTCELPAAPDRAVPQPCSFTVAWLFVVNLPRYAAGLPIIPQATAIDGLLDVCGFQKGSTLAGLHYLKEIVRRRHQLLPDFRYARAVCVRVEADSEVPYQLDGDPGGTLPVEIRVLPERVKLVVSESWAVKHGFRHGQ